MAEVQLIVAAFNSEDSARRALNQLKMAQSEQRIEIQDAAVLRKDRDGKLHIKETSDWGTGKGAAIGGVAGAAVGLIAGPALLVPVAVGALIGGLSAKWRDSEQRDDRLEKLGQDLKPGSSAIIVVAGSASVDEIKGAFQEAGGDTLVEQLGADIAAQLEADHDVAYTAIVTEEGIAVGKVVAGEDVEGGVVEGGMVVADDTGVAASQFIATEDGFAVRAVDVDAETGTVTAVGAIGVTEDDTKDKT